MTIVKVDIPMVENPTKTEEATTTTNTTPTTTLRTIWTPKKGKGKANSKNLAFFGPHVGVLPPELLTIYRRAGFTMLPVHNYDQALESKFSSLLLRGGSDLHPNFYGQKLRFAYPDPHRDDIEWALTRRAISNGYPILGICRGMQVLNVALGGDLIQDIIACGASEVQHEFGFHGIRWDRAASWPKRVNSRHHQCLDRIAPSLKVIARSLDGIPEMVIGDRMVGIQSHPEASLVHEPVWSNLFKWHAEGFLE